MRKILSAIGAAYGFFILGMALASLTAPPPMPAQAISRAGSVTCGTSGQVLFNSAGACTSNSGLAYNGTVLTVGAEIDTVLVTGSVALGHNLQVRCEPTAFACTLLLGDTTGSGHINETIDVEGNELQFGAGTGAEIDLQTGILHVNGCGGCVGSIGTDEINISDGSGGLTGSPWFIFGNGTGGQRIQSVQSAGASGEMMLLENTSNGIIFNNGSSAGGCSNCGTWVTDQAGNQIMAGQLTVGVAGGAAGGTILLQSTTSGGVTLVSDNSTGGILTISTAAGGPAILNNINQIFMGSGTQIHSGSNGTVTITDNGATTNGQITVTKINGVGIQKQVFTSSGTFTIPAGVTQVKVTVMGGGGGGGGSTVTNNGGGGGSAALSFKWLTGLNPTSTLTVTIGAGGTGNSGTTGNAGVQSSVSSGTQTITTITAPGGSAGFSVGATSAGGGQVGGGTGGDLTEGGGGGVLGTGGTGGSGANSLFGGGAGGAGAGGFAGNNATGSGSGGGGGSSGASQPGGTGGSGIAILEWVQ